MMAEEVLQEKIRSNNDIQEEILSIIDCDNSYSFISEDQYINGIYVDFTIAKGNKVKAIVECKGSNIGVNDYVRGIGQITTYDYFAKNNLSIKNYEYDKDYSILFCFPSGVILNRNFNIGLFPYPEKSRIIELNEGNDNIREITKTDLETFAESIKNDKVTISQYYIRDTRLYELYILLHYLQLRKMSGAEEINRTQTEENELRKIGTQDNRNWRNAFIALTSLGLIGKNNLPTSKGAYYSTLNFNEFIYEMYKCYINPYIDVLIELFNDNYDYIDLGYDKISEALEKKFDGKKVLFLTDSDNRYLFIWLKIMRFDFCCILFDPISKMLKMMYNISQCNSRTIVDNILNKGIAKNYINKYKCLIKDKSRL